MSRSMPSDVHKLIQPYLYYDRPSMTGRLIKPGFRLLRAESHHVYIKRRTSCISGRVKGVRQYLGDLLGEGLAIE